MPFEKQPKKTQRQSTHPFGTPKNHKQPRGKAICKTRSLPLPHRPQCDLALGFVARVSYNRARVAARFNARFSASRVGARVGALARARVGALALALARWRVVGEGTSSAYLFLHPLSFLGRQIAKRDRWYRRVAWVATVCLVLLCETPKVTASKKTTCALPLARGWVSGRVRG